MNYEFDVVEVERLTLAVAEAVVSPSEVPKRILDLFDVVYEWLSQSDVHRTGHNYALYRPASSGLQMQVGFPVSARFEDTPSVACIDLGRGRAAHAVHRGEYSGLPNAHARLRAWCDHQEHVLGDLSWEAYGDWDDDPTQLVTDVYIQIP